MITNQRNRINLKRNIKSMSQNLFNNTRIFVILIITLISCKESPEIEIASKIEAMIYPYINTRNFSGSILVAKGENVLFQQSYGLANVELGVHNSEKTRFYIASVTKSFTSTAIFLLEEEGLLSIEDPVSKFIPDYPNGKEITIRQLLTHTSGLPRIVFFPDYSERTLQSATPEEVINYFRNAPLVSNSGQQQGYSNANYALLGYLIEHISGMTYGEFISSKLLKPLGMKDTGFPESMMEIIPKLASGYEVIGEMDFAHASFFDRSWHIGSASIYSTPHDLLLWVEGVLANRVLKPGTTQKMLDIEFGCGWECSERHNRRTIHLTGWDNLGFSSDVTYFPDDSMVVVVLGNLDIISVTKEISYAISAIVFNDDYESLTLNYQPIDETLASKIEGVYKWGDDFYVPGATIEIFVKDGKLFSKQGKYDIGILRISELKFIHRMSWARMEFIMEEDGEINEMIYYGRFKTKKQNTD